MGLLRDAPIICATDAVAMSAYREAPESQVTNQQRL